MGLKVTIPTIVMSAHADQKIRHWVDICPVEISGLGVVEEVEGGYRINDVYLLKQECTAADTELDPAAIADLQMELMMKEDGLQDKLLFWWHSHVNMGVFWSSTDETCILTCLGNRYLISIVYNKRKESKARIDFGNNHTRLTIDDMDVVVEPAIKDSDAAFELFYDRLAEKYNGKTVSHLDFSKELFDSAMEGVSPDFSKFDLGYRDFCKAEYDAKVTQKHTRVHVSSWAGHGGKKPVGSVVNINPERWTRPGIYNGNLWGDEFEDYSDTSLLDREDDNPKLDVFPDDNLSDVFEFMQQSVKGLSYD